MSRLGVDLNRWTAGPRAWWRTRTTQSAEAAPRSPGLTLLLTGLIVVALAAGGGLAALAAWEPFAPGEALYPVQTWVERLRLETISDPNERAARWLEILDLRLQDLDYRAGTAFELYALGEFNQALDQAAAAIDAITAALASEVGGRIRA